MQDAVGADFEDLTDQDAAGAQAALQNLTPATPQQLTRAMAATDLIEAWCKAVRAEIERLLLAGVPVPGYKLVQGRKGAHAWDCADEVEALMKAMRLPPEQMYERRRFCNSASKPVIIRLRSYFSVIRILSHCSFLF